ncbi:hypothetical protein D3C71_1724800 [compost metagenome]
MEDNVLEFRNAVYSRADGTQIDVEINHPVLGWVPFTASANDVEEHGRALFAKAISLAALFVEPVYTIEETRAMMPSLTARQFWMAAANIDIDKDVIIAAIKADVPDTIDRKMMIAELESGSFERTNVTIVEVMDLMDIPAYQADDLWIWAAQL